MKISVILQNENLVVVDKPAGVSVHNNEDPQNLLLLLEQQLGVKKLFPVHRLDKETSGIQILALNEKSAAELAREFQKGSVQKIYTGVLRGTLKETAGVWRQGLSDKAEGRKNPAGFARDRVECETQFKVLKSSQFFSLCEFNLITGRQHQIRKHTSLTNHPIVGDPRYGDPKYNQKMAGFYKTDRMFLHCSKVHLLDHKFEVSTPDIFLKIVDIKK